MKIKISVHITRSLFTNTNKKIMNFQQPTKNLILLSHIKDFKNKFYIYQIHQFISKNQSISHSICKQYPFHFVSSKANKYSETIAQ